MLCPTIQMIAPDGSDKANETSTYSQSLIVICIF